jgi:hypothetical protein
MYVKRVLAAAGISAAIVAGASPAALIASGSPATASASTPAVPAAAAISCTGRIYRTVGKVTCTGTGLFRARGDCNWPDPDRTSDWVRINNSTASAYVECFRKINGVSAETRPGA